MIKKRRTHKESVFFVFTTGIMLYSSNAAI